MTPNVRMDLRDGFTLKSVQSKTYRLISGGEKTGRIQGKTDGLDALRQTIYCILNTERYRYPIYSWNYGVELEGLFGRPVSYVKSELKRVIREALLQDDRIDKVDGFVFEEQGKRLSVTFQVHSRQGILEIKKEVMT